MDALQTAVDHVGGQAALALALGLKQQNVWNWLTRKTDVPPAHCTAIEQATSRAVMRWDLRPADWHRIWPELIGQDGAPPIADWPHPEGRPLIDVASVDVAQTGA